LALDREDTVRALESIASAYEGNGLYSDARAYLREALEIDDCNVNVIARIAHCLYMEGNRREAFRMAKHGLMLDANNEPCQLVVRKCGKLSSW
jgi:tetratricopeptide (TPR) repeat protein